MRKHETTWAEMKPTFAILFNFFMDLQNKLVEGTFSEAWLRERVLEDREKMNDDVTKPTREERLEQQLAAAQNEAHQKTMVALERDNALHELAVVKEQLAAAIASEKGVIADSNQIVKHLKEELAAANKRIADMEHAIMSDIRWITIYAKRVEAEAKLAAATAKLQAADLLFGSIDQLLMGNTAPAYADTHADIMKWRADGSFWGQDSLVSLLQHKDAKLAKARESWSIIKDQVFDYFTGRLNAVHVRRLDEAMR